MNVSFPCAGRRFLSAGLSLLMLSLGGSAFAARDASQEVGQWQGFAHVGTTVGLPAVQMTLRGNPERGPFALQGTMVGLPAVQMPVAVEGRVTRAGTIGLVLRRLTDGVLIGFCDGSVRPVENFGRGSGQDDLGSLNFFLLDDTGMPVMGHMNMLHMFGGLDWQRAGLDWGRLGGLPDLGQAEGAFMPPRGDMADRCSFFAMQNGGPTSSALGGSVLLPAVQFQMVGTANGRGSVIFLCDGSVRTGDTNALIGLLFTGAVPLGGGPPTMIGHFGVGGANELLPAVQKVREAAMSFRWAAHGGA